MTFALLEALEAKQNMFPSFLCVHRLGYMTVSEMLETMHENDLFDIFPEFSKVVHMLAVIPATYCSAEPSFTWCVAPIENFAAQPPQHLGSKPWGNSVSATLLLLTLKPPQHHGATVCQQHCSY